MFDQLIGLILFGLGIKTAPSPSVQGEQVELLQTTRASDSALNATSTSGGRDSRLPRQFTATPYATDGAKRVPPLGLREQGMTPRAYGDLEVMEKNKQAKFEEMLKQKRLESTALFKEKRNVYQSRLRSLRDEKKKEIVAHMDAKITELNTRRVNEMTEHLKKISEILTKVTTRSSDAKAKGVDVASVDSAIAKAQSTIAAAQSAVTGQAGKQYVFSITSDTTLKTDVGATLKQLETDLKSVRDLVIAARQAVGDAVKVLIAVSGGTTADLKPTVTGSPTATH